MTDLADKLQPGIRYMQNKLQEVHDYLDNMGPTIRLNTGWQPIETAPKDGQCFLAYYWLKDEGRPFYQLIGWDVHAAMFGRVEGWRNSCGEEWNGFTHWVTLPEGPK